MIMMMLMLMMIMMIHVYNTKVMIMNLSQAYCRHCTLLVWTQNLEIMIYHSDFNIVSIIIIMNHQELSNLAILLLLDFF